MRVADALLPWVGHPGGRRSPQVRSPAKGGGMQFEVLGPIRVVDEGVVVPIGSERQQRLLGVLLLRAGAPVSSGVLCEHLDVSPGALRVAVSRLRALVGPDAVATTAVGYEWRADGIDVHHFDALLERARSEPGQARQALTDALALWRGAPYESRSGTRPGNRPRWPVWRSSTPARWRTWPRA